MRHHDSIVKNLQDRLKSFEKDNGEDEFMVSYFEKLINCHFISFPLQS